MTIGLQVLGSNATAPSEHGGASGYLLQTTEGVVLVDSGPGVMLSYFQQGFELDQLKAIVLTHMHADHSLDMMAWAFRWTFPVVRDPVPVLLPAGETEKLERFDDLFGIKSLPTMARPITGNFEVSEMPMDGGRTEFQLAGLALTTFQARHAVPSAALRFEAEGKTLVFSSDTGDCEGLREAASGATAFVCEATYLDPREQAMAEHGHLTPALAGEIAASAGVENLILTHLEDPDNGEESVRRAKSAFGSEKVRLARPRFTFDL